MGSPPEDDFDNTAKIPLQTLQETPGEAEDRKGAALTCLTQPRIGLVFRLTDERTSIGRAEDCVIQLPAPGISRVHAEIVADGGTYTLVDLESTNGTFCRGVRVDVPMPLKDRDTIRLGAKVMLRFAFHDALEEKMGSELYERATRDPLTTARNRRYFSDRLDSEWPWARRHERACSLLLLDLDHFKRINDSWGHLAGDEVLRDFSNLVFGTLRQEDLFGRIGGEEFAVLCRATSARDAAILAERLRKRIADHEFTWKGERLPVTVSIGISTSSEAGIESTEQLLQRADERMYRSKRAGRNRVSLPSEVPTDPPTSAE